MFYIDVYFAFLKIFSDWFTFSEDNLSDFNLLWENEYNLPIIGKPRFLFYWLALIFKRIAGIWETILLLAKWAVLNQMRFVRNFVFGKSYSISKNVCPRFSKKTSVLVLLKKIPTIFCWVLLQKYLLLGNKNIFSKSRTRFWFLWSNLWVCKILFNIIRLMILGDHQS